MRRAWVFVCLVLLAACSNKVKESAVALTITYPKPAGYVPACIRVTALDATAENLKSSELIDSETLTRHAEDRTLVLAVYRERGWSEQLQIEVSSYSTEKCEGQAIETRRLAAAVALPEKGAVPAGIVLKAQDADQDRHPATSLEDKAINGTDCNDGKANVYPGAQAVCDGSGVLNVDFNCDGKSDCNGSSCAGTADCGSGFCVAGVCCESACNTPPQCHGAAVCGGGKCSYKVDSTLSCDDGNACTTSDRCSAQGTCAGTQKTCNGPTDQCRENTGTCNPASGACEYPPKPATATCDDGNKCTDSDKCNGSGMCAGTAKVCNSPTGQCYESTGTCNPSSGTCGYAPKPTTADCNDGNACTLVDKCNGSGSCVGSANKTCNTPTGQCYENTGTCNNTTGECSYPAKPTTVDCNDGNACTLVDKCNGNGSCVGSANKTCNTPTGQCYENTGTCDPSSGTCNYPPKPTTTTCDDGQPCSKDDRCNGAGGCAGTDYTCAPPNACQMPGNACSGNGGCLYVADASKNGAACTWNTTTGQPGTCVPSTEGKCSLFPYAPSNFDPDALTATEVTELKEVRVSCNVTLNTSGSGPFVFTPTGTCATPPVTALAKTLTPSGGGPEVLVLYMKRLDIDYGVMVTVQGTRPVIFAIYDQAYIHGSILANATKTDPGAGGNAATCGARVGGNGSGSIEGRGGGGGGGFATAGAGGGAGDGGGTAGAAGSLLTSTLVPLIGGCPGGAGGDTLAGAGGAGGGAVQISVASLLSVDGTVSVSGGGGKGGGQDSNGGGGGGGGGSGGGILLEGKSLQVLDLARLTANGGAGGEGGFEAHNAGVDGSDGSTTQAAAASPGASTSPAGGDGGSGGALGAAPTSGSSGGNQGNDNGGGGGGGGAAGVIRLRAGWTSSCAISGAAVISPAATRVCP
ncbi:putative metal-binding motif-containing protein [Archangium violaceum]|uniref:putative metal-binding motif-containing protein n=1 Tax=Archangium violaceum TaxID=83451 RepID=UPI00194FA90A|nr:putative metal-binding motif-containing protein [Archangium violaceum]QRN98426.1 putative metal-binding motif-containing protein [Archangium violaceum]